MSKNYFLTSLFLSTILVSCGGGGGGGGESNGYSGGGYGEPTNAAPTINNADMNISVRENQTSALTVNASDSNGDTLAYSLSGDDSSLLSISTAGLVTFNTAPDYEDPSDADTNNIYKITASVSDGSLNATKNFEVTVTNDTSDDVTTSNFDGVLIRDGYIQSATVCMPVADANGDDTCEGATYLTTTNADGSFSLDIDDNITATIKLLAEDGFNPIVNESSSLVMGLKPSSANNLIVAVILSSMSNVNDPSALVLVK